MGKIATIMIELEGQERVFLNGGPAHQLNPAFSFFVRCDSQEEIDSLLPKLKSKGTLLELSELVVQIASAASLIFRPYFG